MIRLHSIEHDGWSSLVPGALQEVDETAFDVVVIGGGPAGASAAALLALAGHSVLVIEREAYPRFHIGESLIPGVVPYLEEIGVARAVQEAGFIQKYAAEFITPDLAFRRRYVFADSLTPEADMAYQVERARFDQILLDNAQRAGATVRVGHTVTDVTESPERVSLTVRTGEGESSRTQARFLIDASGQRSLLAGRLGLRRMDPSLKNVAVYAHYRRAWRSGGSGAGDITIVLDPEGWWWVIPLRDDVTSLGFVAPKAAFRGKPDANWFQSRIEATAVLSERFRTAERCGPVRSVSDYAYQSSRLIGERWLLVGDAAAFLDPVFSTGVFLAVASGVHAAKAVCDAARDAARSTSAFSEYASWHSERLRLYGRLVRGFYAPEFVDLFMHPPEGGQFRQAVTSALAGYAEHPDVSWRVDSFLSAARANRDFGLSPRLPGRREAAARLAESTDR